MAEQYSFAHRLLQMSDSSPPTSSINTPPVNTPEQTDPRLTRAVALPDLCAQAVSRHSYITLLQAQAVLLLSKPRRNARLKDTGLSWCLRGKRHRL